MAIALGTTGTANASSGTVVTIAAFTAATGSVMRVDVGTTGGRTVSAVSYNGQSFTELFNADLSSSGVAQKMASYMSVVGADGAAHDVTVTVASLAGESCCARIASWTGVESSSVAASHRTIYSAGDSGGAGADVTVVDSASGDAVVSGIISFATTLTAVETVIGSVTTNIQGGSSDFGMQYKMATGASTAMAWTGDGFVTHVAYALIPAAEVVTDTRNIPGRRIFVMP